MLITNEFGIIIEGSRKVERTVNFHSVTEGLQEQCETKDDWLELDAASSNAFHDCQMILRRFEGAEARKAAGEEI
jgi:hypothetical protein